MESQSACMCQVQHHSQTDCAQRALREMWEIAQHVHVKLITNVQLITAVTTFL